MDSPQNRYLTPIQDEIGLDSEVEELSVADAKVVAAIFKNKGNKSRSVLDSGIMEVITIPCTDGTPALYAVNFENGIYILDTAHRFDFQYTMIDKEEERVSHNFYHMNWGWGGRHDGNYCEYPLYVGGTNYHFRRKDLVITKP